MSPPEPAKIKVLMVDDSKVVCLKVSGMLALEDDIAFDYTNNGLEGVSRAEAYEPTVILQDLNLPDIDGFSLLTHYRSSPKLAHVPILVLSADDDANSKAKAFSLGANDYLLKASDAMEFVARIRYHAARYLAQKATRVTTRLVEGSLKHTIKVLVVNDLTLSGEIIAAVFANESDVEVRECLDPATLCKVADAFLPTVIIHGIAGDVRAGLLQVATLRRHTSTKEVPIIVYSSVDDPTLKAKAFELGANDYLSPHLSVQKRANDRIEFMARVRKHSNDYYSAMKGRSLALASSLARADAGRIKILVVDPSLLTCMVLSKTLTSESNISVAHASDPDKVMEKVAQFAPTVIFMGLVFPKTDGLSLLRHFRGHAVTRDIPIIILTSTEDPATKGKAFAFGANDYIIKGIDKIELISRIQYHSQCYLNSRMLNEAMQKMLETQKRLEIHGNFIKKTFGRYLSDDVVNSILESEAGMGLVGETRDVTIMMTDLRGFTKISENLPPETVLLLINSFLKIMTDILMEFGGTIDEFIGDAILGIFGAPIRYENHAERAVACAIRMQNAMKQVNAQSPLPDGVELEMGIGLNSGEVIVGNIGCEKRTKYGVVGRNVNLASRIESLTYGGQILISETTFRKLEGKLQIANRFEVSLKGVKAPVPVYELTGVSGQYAVELAPDGSHQLTTLEPPLPIELCTYEEKTKGQSSESATIRQLSAKGAWVETDLELELFQNVEITVARSALLAQAHFKPANPAELPEKMKISAKVSKTENRLWQLRFTHIDKSFKPLLAAGAGGA